MKCELYFAFDIVVLVCGFLLGYLVCSGCNDKDSLEKLRPGHKDSD
jgi:hypothetical protein